MHAPVAELVEVVKAACRGWALVPCGVVQVPAGSGVVPPDAPELTNMRLSCAPLFWGWACYGRYMCRAGRFPLSY